MADVSIGDVVAVLRARDEMSAVFRTATAESEKAMLGLAHTMENATFSQEEFTGAIRQFTGLDIVGKANAYVAAIEHIGGATALTQKEQQDVNRALTEAIAKYEALGGEAPAAMHALAAQTSQVVSSVEPLPAHLKRVEEQTTLAARAASLFQSTFGQMLSAFSAAGIITSVTGWLKGLASSAIENAGVLTDLSIKTQLSTKTLQEMQYVAEQAGSDVGQFTDAVFKMGVNVSQGTAKARDAAHDLGISWEALRAASPDDQFSMVVDALDRMENPQKRNEAAVALFGKTAKDILPAIADNYKKIAKEANAAADPQIKAIDRAADAWHAFETRQMNGITSWLGNMVIARETVDKLTAAQQAQYYAILKSGGDAQAFLLSVADQAEKTAKAVSKPAVAPPLPPSFVQSLRDAEDAYKHLDAAKREDIESAVALGVSNDDIVNRLGITDDVLAVAKKAFEDHKTSMSKAAEEAKKLADAQREIQRAAIPLTEAQKAQAIASDQLGVSAETTARVLGVSASAVSTYLQNISTGKDVAEVWRKSHEEMIEASKKFMLQADAEFHADQQKRADATGKAIESQIKAYADYHEKNAQLAMNATDVEIRQLQLTHDAAISELKSRADFESAFYAKSKGEIDAYYQHQIDLANYAALHAQWEEEAKQAHHVWEELGNLSQAFAQLSQIAGGSLGTMVQGIGTLIGSLNTAKQSLDAFSEGKKAFSSGDTLAGITGMATGIMGIASAALAAGKAIAGMFDRNKGRDVVEDFAKTFQTFNLDTMSFNPGGGFNELHKQLGGLGDEGERLWKALTQGVGRNNPEQAAAVIDLINKALTAQKTAIDSTTQAASAAGDAQVEATKKAQAAVDEMTGKIQSLQDSIKDEAPEEVMGIVEANTRAQIDAVVKQRDAAQSAIDQTTSAAAQAAKDAGDVIDTALADREFHVRVKVDLDGLPGGATVSVPQHGTGGYFDVPHMAIVGDRPEYITPRDSIGALAQEIAAAGGARSSGGRMMQPITINVGGRQLLEAVIETAHAEGAA
jgi:predicted transcriptional regulator